MKVVFDKHSLLAALNPAAGIARRMKALAAVDGLLFEDPEVRPSRKIGLQYFGRKSTDSYPDINRWDAVKANVALIDVVREYETAKRSGNRHVMLCPFHSENTPSCYIYDDHYHCFGCGAHGTVIDFYAHKRGIEPQTALDELVRRYIPMLDTDPKARRGFQQSIIKHNTEHERQKSERERLVDLIDKKAEDLADTSPEDRDKLVTVMQLPDEEQCVDMLMDICTMYGIDVPPAELPNLRHPDEPEETNTDDLLNKVNAVDMLNVKEEKPDFLWKPYLLRGKLNLISGDGGAGKSSLTCLIATALAMGNHLPGCADDADIDDLKREPSIDTLFLSTEDSQGEYKTRLRKCGIDDNALKHVKILGIDELTKSDYSIYGMTEVCDMLRAMNPAPGMVVIDPWHAFCGDSDLNKQAVVRAKLQPLNAIAKEKGIAIVLMSHTNKSRGGDMASRIMGSADLRNIVRSALYVVEDDGGQDHNHVLVSDKHNHSAAGSSWNFVINDDCIRWNGESKLTKAVFDRAASNGIPVQSQLAANNSEKLMRDELVTEIIHRAEQGGGTAEIAHHDIKPYIDGKQILPAVRGIVPELTERGYSVEFIQSAKITYTEETEDGKRIVKHDRGIRVKKISGK